MSSALRLSLALILLGATVSALPLQKKKKEEPPRQDAPREAVVLQPFGGTLAEARAAGRERNVPVLIHVLIDGEVENDRYRDKLLADPELCRASLAVITIVANSGVHATRSIEREEGGVRVRRELCGAYGFDSCALHQAAWEELVVQFQAGGVLRCPQTIVILPDGKVCARIDAGRAPQVSEVLAALLVARNSIGPGMTEKQLLDVRQGTEAARVLQVARSWADAWRAWQSVLAITSRGPAAEAARAQQALAAEALSQELAQISARLVPGQVTQGYAELVAFVARVAGTPFEMEAAVVMKKAEADKSLHEEIAAHKLAVEAEQLLLSATEQFAQQRPKAAEKHLRKLFGKRFAATPAAAKARERWPEIAAEEASKRRSEAAR